jgi:hypothetical protein
MFLKKMTLFILILIIGSFAQEFVCHHITKLETTVTGEGDLLLKVQYRIGDGNWIDGKSRESIFELDGTPMKDYWYALLNTYYHKDNDYIKSTGSPVVTSNTMRLVLTEEDGGIVAVRLEYY